MQNGTLFIDEIADMEYETQLTLLRLLDRKEFRRVCGTKQLNVDFRIISATNGTLEKKIERDEFRKDLYYRKEWKLHYYH